MQFRPVSWSFCGRVGKLYTSNGVLYRTITPEWADFYRGLFESGVIERLIQQGLFIDSEFVPKKAEDGSLLVKHSMLPFVSYPFEWCDEMFKDAALFFIRFNHELLKDNLIVRDAHPWNILFDGPKPVFVDLGSIVPIEKVNLSEFVEDFNRLFLWPLRLFSKGYASMARLFLTNWRACAWKDFISFAKSGSVPSKVYSIVKKYIPSSIKRLVRPCLHFIGLRPQSMNKVNMINRNTIQKMLYLFKREIEEIQFRSASSCPDYYDTYFSFPEFTNADGWNSKQIAVANLLDRIRPKSVLDVGSNRGWYSILAAYKHSIVVALDSDEASIRRLYHEAKQRNLPILPLVMDFVWPSPAFGLLEFWPSATERLNADFVMALALIHHLVHLEAMWFEHIVQGLSKFTNRWLLVEFVPYNDPLLSQWNCHRYDWYNLEQFMRSLEKHFIVVETMSSYPSERTLILCQKRSRFNEVSNS